MKKNKASDTLSIDISEDYIRDLLSGKRKRKPPDSATASIASSLTIKGHRLIRSQIKGQQKARAKSAINRSLRAQNRRARITEEVEKLLLKNPALTTRKIVSLIKPRYKLAKSTLSRIVAPTVVRHRHDWSENS